MKPIPIAASLSLASLLVACGGGGAASVQGRPASCQLELLYANGTDFNRSGVPIAPAGTSVARTFNNCNLAQAMSVTLKVCIDHPNPSELSGELKLAGNLVHSFPLNAGVVRGSSCLANGPNTTTSLREYRLDLPSPLSLPQANGPWQVILTDTDTIQLNGFFVAWALDMQGLQ